MDLALNNVNDFFEYASNVVCYLSGSSQVRVPVGIDENAGPAGRRRVRNRMTGGRRAERHDDQYEDYEEADDMGPGGGFPFDDQMPTGKIGTKKLRKLEIKAEKKAMREV